ncbi:MAG TPA: GreA/GreB family elongation factor [Opitutaceae bacterium]|nr:GreA/GreB family elongation factor [Opitutaceae bacterium]
MSRAFVRESDVPQREELPTRAPTLPPGVKNYLTAAGAQRLRKELMQLVEVARPPLASAAPDDIDARRELQALDGRIRELQQSLRNAEIVDPGAGPAEIVRFGAMVTVRDASGAESSYRLVGVDETDAVRHWISWQSPLARALLNARVGQIVSLRTPRGAQALEIRAIVYEP